MIFADSGYFVALSNTQDPYHQKASRIRDLLREGGWAVGMGDLLTVLPMAWEAADCVTRAVGSARGLECYRGIMNNCRVIVPDERLVLEALEQTYRVYADVRSRKPGIIDSIGVAAMRRHGTPWVISFDSGFDLVPDIRRVRLEVDGTDYALGL